MNSEMVESTWAYIGCFLHPLDPERLERLH